MAETKRITNSHHPFPYLQVFGTTQPQKREVLIVPGLALDFNQGNIGFGVRTHQGSGVFFFSSIVIKNHDNFICPFYHMIVGQDMTLLINHESGTHTPFWFLVRTLAKEPIIKITERIGRPVLSRTGPGNSKILRCGLCFCLGAHINHSGVLLFCDFNKYIARKRLGITA